MAIRDRQRLLARYLAGLSSSEEEAEARALLDADPGLRRSMDGLHAQLPAPEIYALVPAIDDEAPHASPGPEGGRRNARTRTPRRAVKNRRAAAPSGARRIWIRWAVPAVLAGIAVLWALVQTPDSSSATRILATAPGDRQSFTLDDGTTVELGVDSRLELATDFGDGTRTVRLAGQAFFDVARDERRPFVVRAAASEVTVLGTSFVVRSYAQDEQVTVAVATGHVLVRETSALQGAELRAGQAAEVGGSSGGTGPLVAVRDVDPEADFGWRRGRLVFRGAPLGRVAEELQRWYGTVVRIEGTGITARRLDATFDAEPLDHVSRTVGLALDLDVTLRADTLVFSLPR